MLETIAKFLIVPGVVAWFTASVNNYFARKRAQDDWRLKSLENAVSRARETSWDIHDLVVEHLIARDEELRQRLERQVLAKIKRVDACLIACVHSFQPKQSAFVQLELKVWKRVLTGDPFPLGNRPHLLEGDRHFLELSDAQTRLETSLSRLTSGLQWID